MRFLARAWAELGRDPAALDDVRVAAPVPLSARVAVGELAADSVAAASLALHDVAVRRGARLDDAAVVLDGARVAASFAGDRYFRLDGRPVEGFAPLSGFWPTADGWVRTHANYPHHERALRRLLELPDGASAPDVAAALTRRGARELEDAAAAVGAIVAAVRTPAQWAVEPVAQQVAGRPLVVRRPGARGRPVPGPADRPLTGVRVLDLTRVLAGPVCTRALSHAGADVLRVDPPQLPEIAWQHLDTGQGKRSTLLDLGDPHDRATFDELLAGAHVLVTGYRPGALDAFGLDDATLAERHPGLVVGRVSAWGSTGPWAHRRGFDSIVQAAIGIADLHRGAHGRPGALPAQALDHASGYLLAAGIAAALADVLDGGPAATVEVALAGTGAALLATAGSPAPATDWPAVALQLAATAVGVVECAPPALGFPGAPDGWDTVGRPWGADAAAWR